MKRFSARLLLAKLLTIIVGLVGRVRLRVGRLRPPFLRRRRELGIPDAQTSVQEAQKLFDKAKKEGVSSDEALSSASRQIEEVLDAKHVGVENLEASVAQPGEEPASTHREKEGRAHRKGSRTTNRRRQVHGRPTGRKAGARKRMRLAKERDRSRERAKAAAQANQVEMSPAAKAWRSRLEGLFPNVDEVSQALASNPERFPPPAEPAVSSA